MRPLWTKIVKPLQLHWSRQAVFIAGGLLVGAAAVVLARLSDIAQDLFRTFAAHWPLAPLALTPLGFVSSAWITDRWFAGAGGSGIPQVIVARATPDQELRRRLVSLRVAAGKVVLLIWGLLTGASIGREGPTVQIGAAIMFAAGRLAPHRQPGFVLAGAAAGVAAAFNTPLAGIVFGIEELSRSFEVRTSGLVIGTVIAGGLTSFALLGDYAYFGQTGQVLPFGAGWIAVPLMGVVGGVTGGAFNRVMTAAAAGLPTPGRIGSARGRLVWGGALGIIVAVCGWLSGGATFGTGYEPATAILHGEPTPPSFAVLKYVATLASAASGIPGGIFSPSLSIGAGIGSALSGLLSGVPLPVMGVLGMTAFLTGVVQAPITGFVIVSEMTQNHALIIPLMLTALIADLMSKLVVPHGVYHGIASAMLHSAQGAADSPGKKDD
jgi:H+/Cl- antiporter ClcA